ncbi:MAG: 50S ribosomal protein L6 [Kiloniellales bacterium]
MSRVGKNPVAVPQGVEVKIDGRLVSAKGPLGQLAYEAAPEVSVTLEDSKVVVKPLSQSKRARSLWGTARARIRNMVEGVSKGYTKDLEITGVGYRAAVQGKNLNLQLGYSHDVVFPIPDGVTVKCDKPTAIAISGADKQLIGQVAAVIRGYRPPEPYKGKGVRYSDESILRKEGKKK